MSVHRRKRRAGRVVWQVTWRDVDGRQRAESFATRREAERRDRDVRELQWQGKVDQVDAGSEPLRDAVEAWWIDHVEPNLARNTIVSYAHVLDCHLLPRLGDVPIRDITPGLVVDLQRTLRDAGVGDATAHRTLMLLSGVMRHAVLRGRIALNPVQPVRVRQPRRKRAIRPLPPESIERLRREFLDRDDELSATLISVMAYAGLRPGEATSLTWEHVGRHTLLVEQSADDGAAKATKTGRIRTVRLLAPLAEDLAARRAASDIDGDAAPIFLSGDGGGWTLDAYKNWYRRRFKPAAAAVGLTARPYDLRHSFASLMIQAGYSAVELAAELGHAPTQTLDTYAHVFSEFRRGERIDPEHEIRKHRRVRERDSGP